MEIRLPDEADLALRLDRDRDLWPSRPTYYGRVPLPVCFRQGADHHLCFSPDVYRHDVLISHRVCAVVGPEAVAADLPPEGLADLYRERFGEWAACYELEWWYAPFGGPRRRVLAAILPTQEECRAACPPAPKEASNVGVMKRLYTAGHSGRRAGGTSRDLATASGATGAHPLPQGSASVDAAPGRDGDRAPCGPGAGADQRGGGTGCGRLDDRAAGQPGGDQLTLF